MALLEPVTHRRTVNPHDALGAFPPDLAGGPSELRKTQRALRGTASGVAAVGQLLNSPRRAIDRSGARTLGRCIGALEETLARLKTIQSNLVENTNPGKR